AVAWLGRVWPDWPRPCEVRVDIAQRGLGGMTTFQFKDGQLVQMTMRLEGPLDRILADHLPHEITHAILADWAGRGLPRWADEGAAIMAESTGARLRQEQALWEILD